MLGFILALVATLVHAALVFSAAPLLLGVVNAGRARLLGRRGPPLLQPYANLFKLLRKAPVIPDTATEYYVIWPYIAFAAAAAAALLVPSFATGMITAPAADFITFVGLLALGRVAAVLAGLETGFGFGGAGAARDMLFGLFAEAALLVAILSFALIAGTSGIDGIITQFQHGGAGISVSLGFALVALLAVALTEAGRLPVDNPGSHLELGMVHEALLLEYSGRFLLLFEYAAMLRLITLFSLIGAIFLPFGMGQAGAVLSWPGGLVLWVLKLLSLAVALALFEVATAKMRVFRVPEFLGVALLLGILSAIFLFVAARLGA
jgi:formate hydrogenlyase subunit 4